MKVFKSNSGTDYYTDYEKSSAFSIIAGTLNASITNVSFDKTQVIRGVETVTATITIKNTGNISGTFYLTASSQDINATWYDFIPTRASLTLNSGSSGTVSVIWAPNSSVPVGNCYFYMKVFKASSGTDYYIDYERSSAFSVIAGTLNASVISVSFDKTQIIRGVETVTATITIKNTGNISGMFYVTASSQDINGTYYDFNPTRASKSLTA